MSLAGPDISYRLAHVHNRRPFSRGYPAATRVSSPLPSVEPGLERYPNNRPPLLTVVPAARSTRNFFRLSFFFSLS